MQSRRYQVWAKLSVLLGGCVLVMMLLIGISLYQVRDSMMTERKMTIRNIVASAISLCDLYYEQAKSGAISFEEAQRRSRDAIRAVRYANGGYLFVNNSRGITQVHPINPQDEGTDQNGRQDGHGRFIIQDLIEVAHKGGDFTYYYYKKPGKGETYLPKLTYAELYGPFDWVIATGIYIDDINDAFYKQIVNWTKIVVFPFALLFVITYFLGIFIAKPMFQLEKEKQKAESATRAKSDFLANMSHEIRTPLNGAMGMLSLVLGTKLDTQQREWAHIAHQSCEELLNLINDILDISKVEAGSMVLEKVPFDLQATIKGVTDLLYPRAHRKGVEIVVAFQSDLPKMFIGDPVRLRQILLNLVGNAVKFTSQGHIMIAVEWTASGDHGQMRFEIRDTGIGIPADKLDYIFEKFSQAEESTTRNFGGTGLGLAICRKLSRLMGGDVGVRSVPGHGSTFWFTVVFDKLDGPPPCHGCDLRTRGSRALLSNMHEMVQKVLCADLARCGIIANSVTSSASLEAMLQQAVALESPYLYAFVDIETIDAIPDALVTFLRTLIGISPRTSFVFVVAPDKPFCAQGAHLPSNVGVLTKPVFGQDICEVMRGLQIARDKKMAPRFVTAQNDQQGWQVATLLEQTTLPRVEEVKTVLIAEDQAINQTLMRTLITQMGYKAEIAVNGAEAVRMAAEKPYDIIFMDGHMPEMDGFEATKQIRAFENRIGRHTPIVALTADAMVGDRDKCLEAGMDEYLRKPVKAAQIKEMIGKFSKTS